MTVPAALLAATTRRRRKKREGGSRDGVRKQEDARGREGGKEKDKNERRKP